ncbi:MAG TPA: hydroxyacylglutathione hydrolase [Deltaproteobacteria bacterium]|nr:hydroxyacylglutathione hydrolase [Deltaproteobacteria bacterium]
MKIKQFRYASDNLGYLIFGSHTAVAIDGGAVSDIVAFLGENGLRLAHATNTHTHADHTAGTQDLLKQTDATFIDISTLRKNEKIELEGELIQVFHTPGHTMDSVTFYFDNYLVAGDTLFNGTVGNCFSGDLKSFYNSIKLLLSFPDETIVYAGHDYVRGSMDFAKSVEPDNREIERFLEKYDPEHIWSTLADERKMNPFLRFNEKSIIDYIKQNGLPVETEYERWESIMSFD